MSGIFRVKKDARFFAASNEPFNDRRLSWEARGVMGYLLSKPDGWEMKEENLINEGPAKKSKIGRIVAELKACGYIRRIRAHKEGGLFDWITEIYESPSLNPDSLQEDTQVTINRLTIDGLTIDGKPGDIVNTEAVSTERVNTETAADRALRTETRSSGNDSAAASEILTALGQINSDVQANPRLGQPLTALGSLASRLEVRGETSSTVRAAWETCRKNGRSPVGAFLTWCQQSYLPTEPSRSDVPRQPQRPLERTVNGRLERWIGNSWVPATRRNAR